MADTVPVTTSVPEFKRKAILKGINDEKDAEWTPIASVKTSANKASSDYKGSPLGDYFGKAPDEESSGDTGLWTWLRGEASNASTNPSILVPAALLTLPPVYKFLAARGEKVLTAEAIASAEKTLATLRTATPQATAEIAAAEAVVTGLQGEAPAFGRVAKVGAGLKSLKQIKLPSGKAAAVFGLTAVTIGGIAWYVAGDGSQLHVSTRNDGKALFLCAEKDGNLPGSDYKGFYVELSGDKLTLISGNTNGDRAKGAFFGHGEQEGILRSLGYDPDKLGNGLNHGAQKFEDTKAIVATLIKLHDDLRDANPSSKQAKALEEFLVNISTSSKDPQISGDIYAHFHGIDPKSMPKALTEPLNYVDTLAIDSPTKTPANLRAALKANYRQHHAEEMLKQLGEGKAIDEVAKQYLKLVQAHKDGLYIARNGSSHQIFSAEEIAKIKSIFEASPLDETKMQEFLNSERNKYGEDLKKATSNNSVIEANLLNLALDKSLDAISAEFLKSAQSLSPSDTKFNEFLSIPKNPDGKSLRSLDEQLVYNIGQYRADIMITRQGQQGFMNVVEEDSTDQFRKSIFSGKALTANPKDFVFMVQKDEPDYTKLALVADKKITEAEAKKLRALIYP